MKFYSFLILTLAFFTFGLATYKTYQSLTHPIKYQNDIRLKNSCELLHSTNLTITEIAQSCGFNDPLYFSRIFKKKYNTSPTQFRLSN